MNKISFLKFINGFKYILCSSIYKEELDFVANDKTEKFELLGSSSFYISRNEKILVKLKADKFSLKSHPIKWFLHDYFEKRLLFQSDSLKEYRSLLLIKSAGLKTPECHGFGISLHPSNKNGSLLLLEYVKNSRVGGDVFEEMNEASKLTFLDRFSKEVARLAILGYVHRDLHYNNILIGEKGEIIWIDAHVRKLPRKKSLWLPAISRSFDTEKLRGDSYRDYVENEVSKTVMHYLKSFD